MPLTIDDLYRTAVYSRRGKRIGKVVDVLFDAEKPAVVGFLVQRPRFLYVLDVRDRFLALDSTAPSRGEIDVIGDKEAWDARAAKRLGLDWERTVVWSRMPVRAEGGRSLGEVGDVEFDPATGAVLTVKLSGGATADLAVGTRTVAGKLVRGYREGAIVVADEAAGTELTGGAAAAAGKASAVAKKQLSEASVAAGKAAREAVTAGKAAAKAAAQTPTGKKAMGWLKSVREELVDAMRAPDDDD